MRIGDSFSVGNLYGCEVLAENWDWYIWAIDQDGKRHGKRLNCDEPTRVIRLAHSFYEHIREMAGD